MSEFQEFLNECLKDQEFREEYEKIQPELDDIREQIDKERIGCLPRGDIAFTHEQTKELLEKTMR